MMASEIEATADAMVAAGWPGFELHRCGGDWMATFFRYTPHSSCKISAVGRDKHLSMAIAKAKEKAHAL
jgi:hypothetical protein